MTISINIEPSLVILFMKHCSSHYKAQFLRHNVSEKEALAFVLCIISSVQNSLPFKKTWSSFEIFQILKNLDGKGIQFDTLLKVAKDNIVDNNELDKLLEVLHHDPRYKQCH